MKARAAVKDVARVLRIPPGEADELTKLIPSGPAYQSDDRRTRSKQVAELQELVREQPARIGRLLRLELAHRGHLAPRCRCTPPAW